MLQYSDFLDIVPRYPHLGDLVLTPRTLRALDRVDIPRSKYGPERDRFGWTVTPLENGRFSHSFRGEVVIAQLPTYNTLFPPVSG